MRALHTYISDKNKHETKGTNDRPEELSYGRNYPPSSPDAAGGNLSKKKRRSSKKSRQSKRKNKKL